jgi:hypothetical protein
MSSWYDMSDNVTEAARELAGNWRRFQSFGWSAKPDVRPEDYAIVYLSNRDSDTLEESNAAAILAELAPFLGEISDGADVETCSHNHWAVGHVDGIVIRCVDADGQPTAAFAALHALAMRLACYPCLDENDWSEREHVAADETWRNCYSPSERIAYIRDNRSQFEFHCFTELLQCVRGKFFAGYASELLT